MPNLASEITAIENYAGMYYQEVIRDILNGLDIAKDLFVMRNVTAPRNLWGFSAENGLRPLDVNVETTNKSAGKFRLRKLEPEIAMKVLKIIPESLRDTFMSEVLSENAQDLPSEFSAYFWQEQAKSIAAELNNNAYFGVSAEGIADFNPASTYAVGNKVMFVTSEGEEYFECTTITTAGQSPTTHPAKWDNINAKCLSKGLGTLIAEEITAGKITNVTSTGTITEADVLDQIDGEIWASIPNVVKRAAGGITINLSDDIYDMRVRALRAKKNNGAFYTEADIERYSNMVIDSRGKGMIKPRSWMEESGRVIWSIDRNLIMGTNQLPGANPFGNFVKGLQHYRTIMKLITCYQIADPRYMGVNDIA